MGANADLPGRRHGGTGRSKCAGELPQGGKRADFATDDASPAAGYFASEQTLQRKEDKYDETHQEPA